MDNFKNNITNERIINFLRYLKENGVITAGSIVNDELDEGKSLSEIFKKDKDGYGFFIKVKNKEINKYKIEFGCQVGPTTGDGAEWEVVFDDKDNIVQCDQFGYYIS